MYKQLIFSQWQNEAFSFTLQFHHQFYYYLPFVFAKLAFSNIQENLI